MSSANAVPNGHGAPPAKASVQDPQDRVVGDEEYIQDVMHLAEKYNLNSENGEIFNARSLGHDPNIDPAQVYSAIPGSGLREELDQTENGTPVGQPHPSKYLPHITGPREENLPADVRGGQGEEGGLDQEGARGRGPGKHEQDLSQVPVDGQAPHTNGAPPHDQPSQNDELGVATRTLPGLKKEEAPGPRTDISLTPRITHLQVSSMTYAPVNFLVRMLTMRFAVPSPGRCRRA